MQPRRDCIEPFKRSRTTPIIQNFRQLKQLRFIERSSGAIIVLMIFLVVMNVAAILLRRRFERRW